MLIENVYIPILPFLKFIHYLNKDLILFTTSNQSMLPYLFTFTHCDKKKKIRILPTQSSLLQMHIESVL